MGLAALPTNENRQVVSLPLETRRAMPSVIDPSDL